MKERKANRELVNAIKAHVRAACTEMRRAGKVLARTRIEGDADTARDRMLTETKGTGHVGVVYYSVSENRRLHDTGRVTLRYQGVNGHNDAEAYKIIAAALRRRNLEVKSTKTGIRVLGFIDGFKTEKPVEKKAAAPALEQPVEEHVETTAGTTVA